MPTLTPLRHQSRARLLAAAASTGAVVLAFAGGVVGFQLGRSGHVPRHEAESLRQQVSFLSSQSAQRAEQNDSLTSQVSDVRQQLDAAEDKLDDYNLTRTTPSAAAPTPSPTASAPREYTGRLTATLVLDRTTVGDVATERARCFSIADREIQVLAGGQDVVATGRLAGHPTLDSSTLGTVLSRTCTWFYTVASLPAVPSYTIRVVPVASPATPDVAVTVSSSDIGGGTFPDLSYSGRG